MLVRDAVLFAGQGSSSLFVQGLSEDLQQFVSTSPLAKQFLSLSFNAFKSEIHDLKDHEKSLLGEDVSTTFSTPLSLATPTKAFISNPIFQNISLYIHQILEYLRYIAIHDEQPQIDETSGFCSGLIPAVVVAVSQSQTEEILQHYAVEGFRTVFWIGVRIAQNGGTQGHNNLDDASWSLVVSGLDLNEISVLITKYNRAEQPEFPISFASILADKTYSLSGHGYNLRQFRAEYLPKTATTRSANVHGFYHGGGDISETTRREITEDIQRRNILFPQWDDLAIPVRSTIDGEYMNFDKSRKPLLDIVLDSMLMHRVEWQSLSSSLVEKAKDVVSDGPASRYRIVGIEPNSKSLFLNIKSTIHPQISAIGSTALTKRHVSPNDIAIVGMGMKFPAGNGPARFWNTIKEGLNVVSEIPSSRFDINEYYQPDGEESESKRKTKSRHGNFLDNPFDFDNGFFRISPREAKSMDPQQRNLLHTSLDALEDAGYAPDSSPTFQKDTFGVYVGVATGDYVDNTRDNIDVYYSTGTLRAFLSGRISYAYGFEGPSVVVDTACSGSTIALYQACRALQNGDCAAALAGGVNVISSPDMHIGLSRAHFLNDSGQCKPFDASADGYCRAEGCGLFVLKRAVDAIAEGDRIYGTIRGIEVNQCGRSKSITYPDSATQAKLFKRLFDRHGIDADSISVVEAHGTGTQAGDFAEINSIRSAFGPNRKPNNPLYVSSVKGNMGHAEAASGAAGLAKLLLMMKEQRIPPQAAHKLLNPRLGDLTTHNIVIPRELTAWRATPQTPRRALLNNFGAAGSNAAVIIEEPDPPVFRSSPATRSSYLLNLSAKTADALQKLRQSYNDFALSSKDSFFEDISYSIVARRMEYDAFRISISADSMENALEKLNKASVPESFHKSKENVIVFVFSGQGGIYQGMGAELLATAPVFRRAVRACDEILSELGYAKTEPCLLKDGHVLDESTSVENTVIAQCACFVLEYALAKLWISFGVVPDIAVGHSLGEYAMLASSGAIPLRDAVFLVAKRAELMLKLCEADYSGMMAIHLSQCNLETILAEGGAQYPGLSIACVNSPEDCVLAGPNSSLAMFAHDNKPKGIKMKQLDVTYGFHSSALDPILEPFRELATTITTDEPKFTIASSTLGRILTKEDLHPGNFVRHARNVVDFSAALTAVETFASGKQLIFLEIGPAPKTLPMVKATLNGKASNSLTSLRPSEEPWVTLNGSLSSLYLHRQNIQWSEVYQGSGARFLGDLPHYPLNAQSFVIPYVEPNGKFESHKPITAEETLSPYSFLKGSVALGSDGTSTFDTKISALATYIKSHAVGGVPICPASVYIELAAQANDLESNDFSRPFNVFSDITFNKPLIYQDGSQLPVQTMRNPQTGEFNVTSGSGDLHCVGILKDGRAQDISKAFLRQSSVINRQVKSVDFVEAFSSRVIYDVVFPRVVDYSEPFLTIKQLRIASSGLEGVAKFQLFSVEQENFHNPPPLVDTLLHAAGFIANIKISANEACICTSVEEAIVPRSSTIPVQEEMTVYCSLIDGVKGYLIADAYALDKENNVRMAVKGMHFKILSLKAFQAQLARTIQALNQSSPNQSHPHHQTTANPITRALQTTPKEITKYEFRKPAVVTIATPPGDAHLHVLQKILSELCQLSDTVDPNTRLEDLGVDSLLFIEMANKLEQEFPSFSGASERLEDCETVLEVSNAIQSAIGSGATSGLSTPELEPTLDNVQSSLNTPGIRTPAMSRSSSTGPSMADFDLFIRKTCGFSINGFDKRATLDSLGVDSLLSIEIEQGLRETFGIDINTDDSIISDKSIEDLERIILSASVSNVAVARLDTKQTLDYSTKLTERLKVSHVTEGLDKANCATLLQKVEHSNTVLFIFHDGSGMSSVYSKIARVSCNVIGISSVDFDHINNSIQTLEQLAAECITRTGLATVEDIILAGWSFGGVLAFEVSRQLYARGKSPRGVILIDSPSPLKHEPLPKPIIEAISSKFTARTAGAQKMKASIEAQFKRNAGLLGKYTPRQTSRQLHCVILQCADLIDTVSLYGVEYGWLGDAAFRERGIKEWEQLFNRSISVQYVKGNHFDLFTSENVKSVSESFKSAVSTLLK